jgi:hypothetical protein
MIDINFDQLLKLASRSGNSMVSRTECFGCGSKQRLTLTSDAGYRLCQSCQVEDPELADSFRPEPDFFEYR